ncbi:MAG: 3'-5' exonuclease [Candidatus Krumholzibacteria bacterium]|jgi:DNA polymerase-3 subunit epsilon|nr:3'-5' exonuclease [Candidatus Krumholzibacteria bacterium]
MQNLQLDRPLVCFDLETTGTDVQRDRIVQIALIRIEPTGQRRSFTSLVNPGVPIPAAATAVHGIRDEDVAAAPSFVQIRPEVERILADADLAGYNFIRFDLPLLEAELARAGATIDLRGRRLIDAMTIFHRQEPRHLQAAVKFYCGQAMDAPHSAQADAEATLQVLDAQLARYPDLPRDAAGLHAFCNRGGDRFVDRTRRFRWNDAGEAVMAFGKHQGTTLRDMATGERRSYLDWMLRDVDFSGEVKSIVRDALNEKYPARG